MAQVMGRAVSAPSMAGTKGATLESYTGRKGVPGLRHCNWAEIASRRFTNIPA